MRPLVTTVGPLIAATATKLGVAQKAAAAQKLVLNGAAADATANNICASQTPAGAGNLLLNGTTAGLIYASYPQQRRIYITGGSDESGKTFTVTGYGFSGLGKYTITEVITGPNASIVSSTNTYAGITSIAVSAATTGAITVGVNGIATLDTGRRILFTSGGDDSAATVALVGTNWAGDAISETLTLSNGSTAYTVLDYKTVTSIATSGAIATTIAVGTNGVASSPWLFFDPWAFAQVTGQCVVSGTVNYDVQETMDNPSNPVNPVAPASVTWTASTDTAVVGATATKITSFAYVPIACRVLLNSETGAGFVTATFSQSGSSLV